MLSMFLMLAGPVLFVVGTVYMRNGCKAIDESKKKAAENFCWAALAFVLLLVSLIAWSTKIIILALS